MKKVVVIKLAVHDEKDKQKAMKTVSGFSGIESLTMDMKDQKLTIIGDIDPVDVIMKLRKYWHTKIVSIGAPDKKNEEVNKDESKKDDEKKDDGKRDDDKKKTEDEQIADLIKATKNYYQCQPCMHQHYY
ncbi:hypothetical protein QQ045_020764 [Rhodiola kirilowii]